MRQDYLTTDSALDYLREKYSLVLSLDALRHRIQRGQISYSACRIEPKSVEKLWKLSIFFLYQWHGDTKFLLCLQMRTNML